jgi:carboxylesterase type B
VAPRLRKSGIQFSCTVLRADLFFIGRSFLGAPNNTYFEWFSAAAGCNMSDFEETLGCLRSAPLDKIMDGMKATGGAGAAPSLGGYIWEKPAKLLQEGRYHRIPVVATTALDEGVM